MAKINIVFNDKTYSIDESVFSAAIASLSSHLSTTMSGSGATITLGGTTYNIDSNKLTAAKNEFIAHLGSIEGTGTKVMIGGVEYSVDSTKINDVFEGLKDVFGELEASTGVRLLSADDLTLTDISGVYLIAEEEN